MSQRSRTIIQVCALFAWAWLGAGDALPAIDVAATTERATGGPLPEFTHAASTDWINSPPLTLADLRGHVVLLHVWAFECWNCYRSFPWLESVATRYAPQGFEVIGVHSPEFEREKVRDSVIAKAAQFGLHHPIMLDNDLSYWRALDNEYWPAWYLIDGAGVVRRVVVGETHAGDARAQALEQAIEGLLGEQPAVER